MPFVGYSQEFAGGQGADNKFPRIKFTEEGQKFRVTCPAPPFMEWVHRIEAPEIQNGVPLSQRTDEGMKLALQWIGSPICLGDSEALQANEGLDPANCPACDAARRCQGISPARRRYAMAVVSYATIPGDAAMTPSTPANAQILIWAFTERIYAKLLSFQAQWKNLKEHDFILGPAERPVKMQKYPVEITPQAAWMVMPEVNQYMGRLWAGPGNQPTPEQLQAACGRKAPLNFLREDVTKAEQRWAMAAAAGTPQQNQQQWAGQQPQQNLAQGFDQILGGQPQPAGAGMHPLEAAAAAASQVPAQASPFAPVQAAPPAQAQPLPDPGNPFAVAAGADMAALQAQQAAQLAAAGAPVTQGFGGNPFAVQQAPAQAGGGQAPGFGSFTQAAGGPPAQVAGAAGGGAAPGFGSFTIPPAQPPQAAVPAAQPGGFGEFTAQGTSNPAPPQAAGPAGPGQDLFSVPPQPVQPDGQAQQAPSFDQLMQPPSS